MNAMTSQHAFLDPAKALCSIMTNAHVMLQPRVVLRRCQVVYLGPMVHDDAQVVIALQMANE